MSLTFRRIVEPDDVDEAIKFLTENDWPFHGRTLSPDNAAKVTLTSPGVESYWIIEDDALVGVVRLLDLDDIPDGSPLFDLRIGERFRGRGIGTQTVHWLNDELFQGHDALHRIEATTRADNAGMRSVLERCGYRLEGEFREAWVNEDGSRSNTMAYALLRWEWGALHRPK